MTDKQQLYLHIGTVKTGTTALQQFFDLNRRVLLNNNISYPKNQNNQYAHHRFSWSLAMSEGKPFSPNWPSDLANPLDEWNYLKKQCTCQKILISSENFFRRSFQSISTLKNFFSEFDVKVIIYWRRRDNLENSWYNQLIKSGETTFRPLFQTQLATKKQLDKWTAAFGKENIILRPYERGQLYKKDVVADFLHYVFGLELSDEFKLPENRANDRLHQVVLGYKRKLNHLNLSLKQKRKIVDPLRVVSSVFDLEGRKSFPVFSPQQRLELIQKHAGESAVIAKEYLGRKNSTLFFDPLPSPDDEWQAYNELLKEDAKKINNYLALHHPDELDIVVQGILMTLDSGKNRKSALELLPGISPERITRILKKTLETPGNQSTKIRQEKLYALYDSRTWKAGMVIKRLYGYLPSRLKGPAQDLARFIYQRMKWT